MIKKRGFILLAILMSVMFFLFEFYYFKSNSKSKETAKMDTYIIEPVEKIFINGVIKPVETSDIYLDTTKGALNQTYVKNRQVIKKGEKLFDYRNGSVTDQIEQVTGQINTYSKQKKQLQDKKQKAETELGKLNTGKNKQANINVGSTVIADSTSTLEGEISSINDQITTVNNQISSSQEQINSLKKKEYSEQLAPIDGKVVLNENSANLQTPYITIESGDYYVEGTVNERDKVKLTINQNVEVLIFSTEKTVNGKIKMIEDRPMNLTTLGTTSSTASGASETSNISNYRVEIVMNFQEGLYYGAHVQAVAKLEQENLKIPKSAILQEDNKQYVYMVKDNKLIKQLVTCLELSSDQINVTSGLKEGDEIMQNPTSDMKEGEVIG